MVKVFESFSLASLQAPGTLELRAHRCPSLQPSSTRARVCSALSLWRVSPGRPGKKVQGYWKSSRSPSSRTQEKDPEFAGSQPHHLPLDPAHPLGTHLSLGFSSRGLELVDCVLVHQGRSPGASEPSRGPIESRGCSRGSSPGPPPAGLDAVARRCLRPALGGQRAGGRTPSTERAPASPKAGPEFGAPLGARSGSPRAPARRPPSCPGGTKPSQVGLGATCPALPRRPSSQHPTSPERPRRRKRDRF